MDHLRNLYISRVGVSEHVQLQHTKSTRQLLFQNELIPSLNVEMQQKITRMSHQNLPKGHALEGEPEGNKLDKDIKAYLTEVFNRGTGPNNRKEDPAELAVRIRRVPAETGPGFRFQPNQWPSKEQITSFFCRLFAEQKKQVPKARPFAKTSKTAKEYQQVWSINGKVTFKGRCGLCLAFDWKGYVTRLSG